MVGFILFCLGNSALASVIHICKHMRKLWIGEEAGTSFVVACVLAALFVLEVRAFQWLWQLDDRFDLSALAHSAGIG